MSSILAVIPARYDSSRFPGKPLADLNGKTMIQRVYEQAKKSSALQTVIIATDDARIYEHAKQFGAEVMMTSPSHRNGTERIAEVVKNLDMEYDAVLNIQGDEPFVEPSQINTLCELIMQESAQIATLAKAIEEERELNSPNTVKVVFNQLGNALYFSRYAIPFQRNISTDVIHYKHIGMYAFNMKTFLQIIKLPLSPLENAESLEQLRWLDAGFKISIGITNFESIGIDTPEDLTEALKRL